jgi:hypothetical protein
MKIPACQVIGSRGAPWDTLRAPDLTCRAVKGMDAEDAFRS